MSYRRYSLQRLIHALQSETPELSEELARQKAILIRRELGRLHASWRRSQARHRATMVLVGMSVEQTYWLESEEEKIF